MKKRLSIILVFTFLCSVFFCLNALALDTVKIEEGTYVFASCLNTNMVMDVSDGSSKSGANIQLYKYNGSDAQMFTIKKSGSYYTITPRCSNMKVDVQGGTSASGANVWQYKSNGSDAQKWQFYNAGNGYYYIRCKIGNKALDVAGGKTTNGTNIQMYTLNQSKAQKWKLIKVSSVQIQAKLYTTWGRIMPCEKAVLYSSSGKKLASFTGNDYNLKLNAMLRYDDDPSYIVVETSCFGTPMKGTHYLNYGQIKELWNKGEIFISCIGVTTY